MIVTSCGLLIGTDLDDLGMTLNDLKRRNSPYLAFFSPISISFLAKYVAVVEYRSILSVNIFSIWILDTYLPIYSTERTSLHRSLVKLFYSVQSDTLQLPAIIVCVLFVAPCSTLGSYQRGNAPGSLSRWRLRDGTERTLDHQGAYLYKSQLTFTFVLVCSIINSRHSKSRSIFVDRSDW